MVKIPTYFNAGDTAQLTPEKLYELIQRMYFDLAVAINRKPDVFKTSADMQIADTFLSDGDININLNTNKVQMATNHPTQTTITATTLS